MQLLRFVLIITLFTHMIPVLAVPVVHTVNGQRYIKANSGDVWERIRLGLKIPSPTPLSQTVNPEKNNPTHAVLYTPETKESVTESTLYTGTQNYIIRPQTAIAPTNNYTALGLRLKFGAKSPLSTDDGCLPILIKNQQEHNRLSAENIPLPSLRRHTVLVATQDGFLRAKPEITESLPQATSNLNSCVKPTKPLLVDASKQGDGMEKNNAKKTMINERINKQIALFSRSPDYLYRVAERARPYLYYIVEGLSKSQLPLDLALLPIVESGYQPTALSPKGAAGLWQFIPSTGKDYDLKQSNHYDDRLDILASTQAAIRFLSDLNDHFNGDWLLALAAYNCGQGAVDKAISRNQAEGLDSDYWSLRLPEETQDYVPRLLALTNIFANPASYGLKFSPIKNEPYFVKVKINHEIDIKYLTDKKFTVLAKLADLSHEQFYRLNPGYLNPELSTQHSYTFLLPHANASQLHRLLTSVAQFMAEPVSPSMNNSHSDFEALPYSWNLSPNIASINLIKFSGTVKQ